MERGEREGWEEGRAERSERGRVGMNLSERTLPCPIPSPCTLSLTPHLVSPNFAPRPQAMAFGLYLLDSDNATDRNNITRNKRIKLERFGKIFKVGHGCTRTRAPSNRTVRGVHGALTRAPCVWRCCVQATPVVPLFGDLSTNIVSILKRASHIDDARWSYDPADEVLRRSYHIIYFLDDARNVYRDYMTELALFTGDVRLVERMHAGPVRACVFDVSDLAHGPVTCTDAHTDAGSQAERGGDGGTRRGPERDPGPQPGAVRPAPARPAASLRVDVARARAGAYHATAPWAGRVERGTDGSRPGHVWAMRACVWAMPAGVRAMSARVRASDLSLVSASLVLPRSLFSRFLARPLDHPSLTPLVRCRLGMPITERVEVLQPDRSRAEPGLPQGRQGLRKGRPLQLQRNRAVCDGGGMGARARTRRARGSLTSLPLGVQQFLTMIKSLTDSLHRAALANMDNIAQHVYFQTMSFVGGTLTNAINNARKKKKPSPGLAYGAARRPAQRPRRYPCSCVLSASGWGGIGTALPSSCGRSCATRCPWA